MNKNKKIKEDEKIRFVSIWKNNSLYILIFIITLLNIYYYYLWYKNNVSFYLFLFVIFFFINIFVIYNKISNQNNFVELSFYGILLNINNYNIFINWEDIKSISIVKNKIKIIDVENNIYIFDYLYLDNASDLKYFLL